MVAADLSEKPGWAQSGVEILE